MARRVGAHASVQHALRMPAAPAHPPGRTMAYECRVKPRRRNQVLHWHWDEYRPQFTPQAIHAKRVAQALTIVRLPRGETNQTYHRNSTGLGPSLPELGPDSAKFERPDQSWLDSGLANQNLPTSPKSTDFRSQLGRCIQHVAQTPATPRSLSLRCRAPPARLDLHACLSRGVSPAAAGTAAGVLVDQDEAVAAPRAACSLQA